jgi:hypothetical protein
MLILSKKKKISAMYLMGVKSAPLDEVDIYRLQTS